MENEKNSMKPVAFSKLDYLGPELPKQLPNVAIDFNEMQNESEDEIDILLADGEDMYIDVSEFHAVMNSILEYLDLLIHIIEDDAGPQDAEQPFSGDTDFNAINPEQHGANNDSGVSSNLSDECIKLIDS